MSYEYFLKVLEKSVDLIWQYCVHSYATIHKIQKDIIHNFKMLPYYALSYQLAYFTFRHDSVIQVEASILPLYGTINIQRVTQPVIWRTPGKMQHMSDNKCVKYYKHSLCEIYSHFSKHYFYFNQKIKVICIEWFDVVSTIVLMLTIQIKQKWLPLQLL